MKLTRQEQQELFGEGYSDEYAAEAEQRWGTPTAGGSPSGAPAATRSRTGSRSRPRWTRSTPRSWRPSGPGWRPTRRPAMDAAEQHRRHIHDRFYDLSYEVHRDLGRHVRGRPAVHHDLRRPGDRAWPQYVRDAIHANADRAAG